MKLLRVFVPLLMGAAMAVGAQEIWPSPQEIERLSVAVALADYPIPQSRLQDVIGLAEHPQPILSGGDKNGDYVLMALSVPENPLGYYALQIRFKAEVRPPASIAKNESVATTEERIVSGMEVVFCSSSPGLRMKVDPEEGWRKRISELRKAMKEKGMSPREFSEWFLSSGRSTLAEPPNKSPEATPGQRPPLPPSPPSGAPQL